MHNIPPAPNTQGNERPLEIDMTSLEHDLKNSAPEPTAKNEHSSSAPTEIKHKDSAFHVSEKFLRLTSMLALIAWFLIAIILSLAMGENPFFVFLGLSPVIFTIVVTYILVDRYHMETGFLMVFPMIFSGMFMVLGVAGLLGGLDWKLLTVVNFVCGIIFEAVLVMQHSLIHITFQRKEPEEKLVEQAELNLGDGLLKIEVMHKAEEPIPFEPSQIVLNDEEDVKKFVANIEDKAKAINAVIGRVYSVKHGGSEALRKKIRIDPEHYNGFNELKDKRASRRKIAAVRLLEKILATLKQLKEPEEDLFTKSELGLLVDLKRHPNGEDKVIDVLVKNDSDPVKTYFDSAIQFCQDAVKVLKLEIKKAKQEENAKKSKNSGESKPGNESNLEQSEQHAEIKKDDAVPKRSPLKKDHLKRLVKKKQVKEDARQLTLR